MALSRPASSPNAESAVLKSDISSNPEAVMAITSSPASLLNFAIICPDPPVSPKKFFQPLSSPPQRTKTSSDKLWIQTDLGRMAGLPAEVVSMILIELDLATVVSFGQVNRYAKELISTIPEVRILARYAPETIYALRRLRLAARTPVLKILDTLRTENCVNCGCFGGFVFLPDCERACFECLNISRRFQVLTVSGISKKTKVPSQRLKNGLPTFVNIEGNYSLPGVHLPKRHMVTATIAAQYLKDNNFSQQLINKLDIRTKSIPNSFTASIAMTYLPPHTKTPQHGYRCRGCGAAAGRAWKQPQPSLYGMELELSIRLLKVYSEKRFYEHVGECAEAGMLWAASERGKLGVEDRTFKKRARRYEYYGTYEI